MEAKDRPISFATQSVGSAGKATIALEKQLSVYNAHLIELLPNEGKYVVIHGDDIAGAAFDTYDEALSFGYEKYGLAPFLVKQINQAEPIHYFSRDLPGCRF
jgi:hypothetical protein